MTPPCRIPLNSSFESGVPIAFSRCRRHRAAEPALFWPKNELVPQRGGHNIAKTQYVCHFHVLAVVSDALGRWLGLTSAIFQQPTNQMPTKRPQNDPKGHQDNQSTQTKNNLYIITQARRNAQSV